MSDALPRVLAAALERWQEAGLVTAEQARDLRAEAEGHAARDGRRRGQYLMGITAAVVLVLAAGAFTSWAWPMLSQGARSMVLAAVGVAVALAGRVLEDRSRWRPAAYLLQTGGMVVLLMAFVHSGEAWSDGSPGGLVVGLLALVTPLLATPTALGRRGPMPAVHAALSFAFLAVFLDRATTLSNDAIVWILDGVLVAVTALLLARLRRVAAGDEAPWALPAFVGAVYAGLVLVVATALGPFGLGDDAVWAADVWLAVVTALTLWGLHRAPPALQRDGFRRQLVLCVLLAVPLGFWTALEGLDAPDEVAALLVAAVGAAALRYGLRRSASQVVMAGSVAVLAASWFYAVERGRALGAVLALVLTAALLFWLSGRIGRDEGGTDDGGDRGVSTVEPGPGAAARDDIFAPRH
ncbi:MAG: hypothetical protein KY453_02285 [Gemmatimonadetes bacterium]|nr:hypothetical protein [Gemmatimonadota bacterium]